MDLTDKSQLIGYLQSQGLYTKHSLGQNFLIDRKALDQIIEAAELSPHPASPCKGEELVIEVGPGVGTLTDELIKKADKLISIEIDKKLSQLLYGYIAKLLENNNITMQQYNNFKLVNSDIMSVNLNELVGKSDYKVVANIPYYITSKIIKLFLTAEKKPETLVVLVQKEVAERICAQPGEMSVLSLSVQAFGDPSIVGIVKKDSFFPAPEVDSAILKIDNIEYKTPEISEKDLFRAIKMGFASKRKTLHNNLAAGLHIDKDKANDIIKSAGLSEKVRAQELTLEDWTNLAGKILERKL